MNGCPLRLCDEKLTGRSEGKKEERGWILPRVYAGYHHLYSILGLTGCRETK